MLVFVDESGDTGIKRFDSGTSSHFMVGAVVFESDGAAIACRRRIDGIKQELGFSGQEEFHFTKTNRSARNYFFEQIRGYEFFYSAFVLNKKRLDPNSGFKHKESMYKMTVRFLFENAAPHLKDAIVYFDKCGNRDFSNQLKKYLKRRITSPDGCCPIREVKSANSHSDNLLQLADMICGAVNRSFQQDKKDRLDYRNLIQHRERQVRIWP